ncbi:hypothetical protein SCH01S_10_00620 [Sphingomonas changbaiensis NBRC 104936]|uniref:PilZ domain-containing protein n=1 Tax=Sphingomonas changbaiensis NBRC 104936 TaxID=1219043 RepID=A0A0E9MKB4_9SPHN|nr:PilZ domain-containing protein [Sphingomonas changbaiensis]GAO38252.1 hypothetical protein SCH01S_10_00620 [Sphingomonas changbaiensis NBRC 104936]
MQQLSGVPAYQKTERRKHERHAFTGAEVFLFPRWDQVGEARLAERLTLRLKDVSVAGLSGLIDGPLNIGDIVFVQFEETLIPAAEVIWVRRTMIGFALTEPLAEARFQRLLDAHEAGRLWSPAMRARSDLPSWWTDVGEHERGRQAVRSGD